jgi:murein DD-endopeptidase MepM/ murein hydrolase activator NlpD
MATRKQKTGISIAVGGLGLALIAIPLLMTMVLMGGVSDLENGCYASSSDVTLATAEAQGLSEVQAANASTIVTVGIRRGIPERGLIVALAVAHQESAYLNYANDGHGDDLAPEQRDIGRSLGLPHDAVGSDHGSLGIFQQQWPWWGTMHDLMDPATAADKFYDALLKVNDWQDMTETEAGQAVQHSAYLNAYADDVPFATVLLGGATGLDDQVQSAVYLGGGTGCVAYASGQVVFPLPQGTTYVDQHNYGHTGSHWESTHTGTDLSTSCGTPVLAATDGTVHIRTDTPWAGPWLVEVSTGAGTVTTWYAHMQALTTSDGDNVTAGQQIGYVGELGNTTGCHLHFEVHPTGDADTVDPSEWLKENVGTHENAPRGGGAPSDGSVTVMTANIRLTLSADVAANRIRQLLAEDPDVLFLQEVSRRNLTRIASTAVGNWAVWQPPGIKGESALIWDADRFQAGQVGVEPGWSGRGESWIVWALLTSSDGTLPVISLHMPSNSSKIPRMAELYQDATAHYQRLVARLSDAGYPPIIGADWNHPLDRPRESWSPVPALRRVGLTTNWIGDRPCRSTRVGGGAIDGFGYNDQYLRVVQQGCLPPGPSDHRPVWVTLAPAA